jgi:hypothetical protein
MFSSSCGARSKQRYPAVKEGAIRRSLLCCPGRVDLVKCRRPFLGRDPERSGDAEGLERWAQDGCDLVGRGELLVVGVHEDAARDLEAVLAVMDLSVW